MSRHNLSVLLGVLCVSFVFGGCTKLERLIQQHELEALEPAPEQDPAKVALGQMLFFDKELSGTRDVACSTCHMPGFGTGDAIPLSSGSMGEGLGPDRTLPPDDVVVGRNAPPLFNLVFLDSMFWDGNVQGTPEDGFTSDHPGLVLTGLDNEIAAQAMFPPQVPAEMRGFAADDIYGAPNELGVLDQDNPDVIWDAIMDRVRAIPEYVQMFAEVYPDVAAEDLKFQHAANAIAAFEIDAFHLVNSPWDLYLGGDKDAMSEAAVRGAEVFFGDAACGGCHNGMMLSDGLYHVSAAPQVGPGKNNELETEPTGSDMGRWRVTRADGDQYAFSTPPLRNVELTGPWTHAGAYATLDGVVRHMLDPAAGLAAYDSSRLRADFRSWVFEDATVLGSISDSVDELFEDVKDISEDDIADLMEFLKALTDPAALDLEATVTPTEVPSGLPIDVVP